MTEIDFGITTNTGRVRDHNEDSVGVFPELGLFIVADGMGGHQGGEVASALVVEAIAEDVRDGAALSVAIENAHHAVLDAGRKGQGTQGMGATVVALHMDNSDYEIAWVGDSRAYLWNGHLQSLTRDHSYVQRMIDAGALTEEEAREHPERSVITQALGAEDMEAVQVDTVVGRFAPGQKILLCSDGLTSMINDEDIAAIMGGADTGQAVTERLVQAANEAGGDDNISVVLVAGFADTAEALPDQVTRPMQAVPAADEVNDAPVRKRMLLVVLLTFLFVVLIGLAVWQVLAPVDSPETPNGQLMPPASKTKEGEAPVGRGAGPEAEQLGNSPSSMVTVETVHGEESDAGPPQDDPGRIEPEWTPTTLPTAPDAPESVAVEAPRTSPDEPFESDKSVDGSTSAH